MHEIFEVVYKLLLVIIFFFILVFFAVEKIWIRFLALAIRKLLVDSHKLIIARVGATSCALSSSWVAVVANG